MLTKLVWIANDAAQIMLIGRFLGIDSITWALQVGHLHIFWSDLEEFVS